MIPIPPQVYVFAFVVTLAIGAVFWFNRFMDERDDALKRVQTQALEIAQLGAQAEVAAKEKALTEEYAGKHLELVGATNAAILEAVERAQITVTTSNLQERAATVEGRDDLNRRAEERARQIYDAIEKNSDWKDVYAPAAD